MILWNHQHLKKSWASQEDPVLVNSEFSGNLGEKFVKTINYYQKYKNLKNYYEIAQLIQSSTNQLAAFEILFWVVLSLVEIFS